MGGGPRDAVRQAREHESRRVPSRLGGVRIVEVERVVEAGGQLYLILDLQFPRTLRRPDDGEDPARGAGEHDLVRRTPVAEPVWVLEAGQNGCDGEAGGRVGGLEVRGRDGDVDEVADGAPFFVARVFEQAAEPFAGAVVVGDVEGGLGDGEDVVRGADQGVDDRAEVAGRGFADGVGEELNLRAGFGDVVVLGSEAVERVGQVIDGDKVNLFIVAGARGNVEAVRYKGASEAFEGEARSMILVGEEHEESAGAEISGIVEVCGAGEQCQ